MTKLELDDWVWAVMMCFIGCPTGPMSDEEVFYDLWLLELNAARHGYTLKRQSEKR